MPFDIKSNPHADVVELADALASGASGSNLVRVQVPPSAPDRASDYPVLFFISWRRDSVEYARNEAYETINHPLCGCATEVIQRSHLSL